MISLQKVSKPQFEHDCDSCIYLGTYSDYSSGNPRAKHVDCYWCNIGKEENSALASILGRYSSAGPDYSSSHPPEAFASGQDYLHYAQAWYLFSIVQAIRAGLYKPASLEQITYYHSTNK